VSPRGEQAADEDDQTVRGERECDGEGAGGHELGVEGRLKALQDR
jgi:hypothetical protein